MQVAYDLTEQDNIKQVDAVGLLCPLPILRLKKRTAGLERGMLVDFFTDDPSGRRDLQSLCELVGHELLLIEELDKGVIHYRIKLA